MSYNMTGTNPIEFYYPDGYGEIRIVEQDESRQFFPVGFPGSQNTFRRMIWLSPQVLNRCYNETSPIRPIYEGQRILRNRAVNCAAFSCETALRIRASYQSYRNFPQTTGGSIKYAILDGKFPPGLTLDIDTGSLFGEIDDLDTIFADEFGLTSAPPDREADITAASLYNYDFGEQGAKRYTEDNYGGAGSTTLHEGGFAVPKEVVFIARAFNSNNPLDDYIDGRFVIRISNNWSNDRDQFVLNIRNQFFVDGKPVTNKQYLYQMKLRGYFPGCGFGSFPDSYC